jgi:HAD superfamily hydrolase (TIGR01509 family)
LGRLKVIRSIVFDVGWVFVNLNPRPILDCLAEHECGDIDLKTLISRVPFTDHETGRMCGRALLECFAGLARRPVDVDLLHAKWVDMFELQPRMVDLAHRLSDRYRVHILSNVGDLHWAHLSREYGLHRIGHGALPSFLTGFMKPDPGIYAEAERRFALEPRSTLFIDDRAENVAAARSRGWQAIEHADFQTTLAGLGALGVTP